MCATPTFYCSRDIDLTNVSYTVTFTNPCRYNTYTVIPNIVYHPIKESDKNRRDRISLEKSKENISAKKIEFTEQPIPLINKRIDAFQKFYLKHQYC